MINPDSSSKRENIGGLNHAWRHINNDTFIKINKIK